MIQRKSIPIDLATGWQRPFVFLVITVLANWITFSAWSALLNNFSIEQVHFTGREIGILQSLREIPGLLAFTAIGFLLIFREQTFAILALVTLGIGTGLTGYFPNELGFYTTTIIMSAGFHYFETINHSLTLQWLPRDEAPALMGRILSITSIGRVTAFTLIGAGWWLFHPEFKTVYLIGGFFAIIIAAIAWFAFPDYEEKVIQHKKLILRSRYWLYYALTFMGGARRQIFVVFAGFLMVEKFNFTVPAIIAMFLANEVFNIFFAPLIGRLIGKWGERNAMIFEYTGLIGVFTAYAFVTNPWVASGLYIIDHAFFALAIAMRTYFQKIGDPADMAPTAGIAFSINHIAAVIIPVILGFIWLENPAAVFLIGTAIATTSLILALLVPRNPKPGRETILKH